jgi:hypothetical protein
MSAMFMPWPNMKLSPTCTSVVHDARPFDIGRADWLATLMNCDRYSYCLIKYDTVLTHRGFAGASKAHHTE